MTPGWAAWLMVSSERADMKLDGKFHGVIVKNKDQSIVPQDQWVVFLAKDNAFPATLRFYFEECKRLGAGPDQVQAVKDMMTRLDDWRATHTDKCKVPDVQPGEIVV